MENFRLRVFRAVATHLNFTRAAQELLLTQPAVTQQIKLLEDELGARLFDRAGGRIALTPGGAALLPYAEQMRALSEEALRAVAAAYGQTAGELAVGASQTIGRYLLPRLIAGFQAVYPKVRLTVRSGNTDAMLEALVRQEIQLALIEGPEQRRDVHVEPFLEDHMVLVVAAGHEFADREMSLQELKALPLLMREFGSGSRRIVEQGLDAANVKAKDLHVAFELDSTEALLQAAEAGLGATFCSRWAVRNQLALGTLKVARVRGLKLRRQFSLARVAGPEPAGVVAVFRAFLLQQSEELSPKMQR